MCATTLLSQKPSLVTWVSIIKFFFAHNQDLVDTTKFQQYITYCERELVIFQSTNRFCSPDSPSYISKHEDILEVVSIVRENSEIDRVAIREKLKLQFPGCDQAEVDRSLELGIRLSFMLNLRAQHQIVRAPNLTWHDTATFKDFLETTFPRSSWKLNAKESRIHPLFTAAFMIKICGLRVEWTHCLADHLFLDRDRKNPERRILRVFSYKYCLQMLLESTNWAQLERDSKGREMR